MATKNILILGLIASLALNVGLAVRLFGAHSETLGVADAGYSAGLGDKSSFGETEKSAAVAATDPPDWSVIRGDLDYLLRAGDVRLAVRSALQERRNYPLQLNVLIDEWVDFAGALLEEEGEKNAQFVSTFLEEIAAERYHTIDYLLLRANWLFKTKQYIAAIDLYAEQLTTTTDPLRAEIQQQFKRQLQVIFEAIESRSAWPLGLEVADRLTWHWPAEGDYLLFQALMNIRLEAFEQAKQILRHLASIAEYRGQANQLLNQLADQEKLADAIPLDLAGGSQYIAKGLLNESATVRLLVDTGASLSVLDQKVFARVSKTLDHRYIETSKFNTAGGVVEAPIFQFSSFSLGSYRVENINFAVMDLSASKKTEGLLGMNYLGAYKFQIDQGNNALLLSPR